MPELPDIVLYYMERLEPRVLGQPLERIRLGSPFVLQAGSKKRATLHLGRGEDWLRTLDPGGIDVFETDLARFRAALLKENHTAHRCSASVMPRTSVTTARDVRLEENSSPIALSRGS